MKLKKTQRNIRGKKQRKREQELFVSLALSLPSLEACSLALSLGLPDSVLSRPSGQASKRDAQMSTEVAVASDFAPVGFAGDSSAAEADRSSEVEPAQGDAGTGADDTPPPMCEIPGQGFLASFFGGAAAEPEPELPKELATDGQWEVEPKEAVLARAAELGLSAEAYDADDVLFTPTGKQIGRTQLGQVVFYYAKAMLCVNYLMTLRRKRRHWLLPWKPSTGRLPDRKLLTVTKQLASKPSVRFRWTRPAATGRTRLRSWSHMGG